MSKRLSCENSRGGRDWIAVARLAVMFALLLTAATASAVVRTSPQMRKDPARDPFAGDPGLPTITSVWLGGSHSMPYNVNSSYNDLVRHAKTLDPVLVAIAEFQRRGYIRRADQDTAGSGVGNSTAILCFEKPGVPFSEQQAIIVVHSFAVQLYPEHWYPVTMVHAKVVRDSMTADSLHLPAMVNNPEDEPFTMRMIPELGANQEETVGYSDWEGRGSETAAIKAPTLNIDPEMRVVAMSLSPDERAWIDGYNATVNLAMLAGMVGIVANACRGYASGGAPGAIKGGCEAFIISCIGVASATQAYLYMNPYPAQVAPKR